MKAPCSGAICIIAIGPSFAVASISERCTASGGAPCATRYSCSAGVMGVCLGASAISGSALRHREPGRDRLLFLGLLDQALALVEDREAGVTERLVGLERDELLPSLDRAVEVALPFEDHGEPVPGDREPGIGGERRAIAGRGLVEPAG